MNIQQTLHEIAKFQFILAEGRKGNHLLFSSEMIRGTFDQPADQLRTLFQEKLDEINQALNHTFSHTSFEEKRNFIATLAPEIQHALIFGYFQLLEGAEEEAKSVH